MSRPVDKFTDPLADPALRGPGVLRMLRESFGGLRRQLAVAQIEVTSACPGRCGYCPHTTLRDVWRSRHMSDTVFARLWPLLLETERAHLQGWGEPFLHPRFFDFVRLARRADCRVSTTSCGLFMSPDFAADLVASGIDIAAFSLAGTTPESNDSARLGVDFNRVLEAITTLQTVRRNKMGVHLELHFAYLLLASRLSELRLLPELMRDLGMHAAVVSTLDWLPGSEWAAEAYAPHETEKIAEARAELEQAAARAQALDMRIFYSLPTPEARRTCLEHPDRSVYIDAEGLVAPCIYVNLPITGDDPTRRVFGSCMESDPLEILARDTRATFLDMLASGTPDTPCITCAKRFAVGNRR